MSWGKPQCRTQKYHIKYPFNKLQAINYNFSNVYSKEYVMGNTYFSFDFQCFESSFQIGCCILTLSSVYFSFIFVYFGVPENWLVSETIKINYVFFKGLFTLASCGIRLHIIRLSSLMCNYLVQKNGIINYFSFIR